MPPKDTSWVLKGICSAEPLSTKGGGGGGPCNSVGTVVGDSEHDKRLMISSIRGLILCRLMMNN